MDRTLANQATNKLLARARGVVVTESRFAPDIAIEPHTHQSGYLCVTLAGSVVDTLARRQLEAAPGYSCWVPPGVPHANRFGSAGAGCLIVEIPEATLDALGHDGRQGPWGAIGGSAACRGLALHGKLRAGVGTSLDIDEFCVAMLSREHPRAHVPVGRPAWLARIREMLDAHIENPPSLTALAEEAGVHPMHLLRVFRAHMLCSPGQYVQTRRIAKACQLLAETATPLSFVALTVGYYDQSHFTRAFHLRTGLTPGAFRALALGHQERAQLA